MDKYLEDFIEKQYLSFCIVHKDSDLYVKEIEDGVCTLTNDESICMKFDYTEDAEKALDSITHKNRFWIDEIFD